MNTQVNCNKSRNPFKYIAIFGSIIKPSEKSIVSQGSSDAVTLQAIY